ncbi:MAG: nucleotidyltransferase domain-containing protein [Anaerolineae bacterium]|nr:nucleotidyltransferase domain-containing protein [Anaerolineae bacterium]
MVKQLSPEQRELLSWLSNRLAAIPGIRAVVLAGSYARGRARAGSDIDLGLLYSEAAPFSVQSVRDLAEDVNDMAEPVVTGFYEWGPWVNGGAWLTIGGQRLDFIYRSLEHLERVIAEAEAGRYELDYAQQPPFGFFSATYLGEVAVCLPLFDPEAHLARLKRRVEAYPEALRQAVVQDYLWAAEFGVAAFASKFAARADTFGTGACLTRAIHQLVLVLFALNRQYPINDKTVLAEVGAFDRAPREFGTRVQQILGHLGHSEADLQAAVESVGQLIGEVVELTEGLYRPRFRLPK